MGSSMGGIVALTSVAVLGDGRLAAADADPNAPVGVSTPPRPSVVAVVAESVTPELRLLVARRLRVPLGSRLGDQAFAGVARAVGVDPRATEPIRAVRLLEDVPLLLVAGGADAIVTSADADRLAAASPDGTRCLVVPGAGHGDAHATDPAAWEDAVSTHLRSAFEVARS